MYKGLSYFSAVIGLLTLSITIRYKSGKAGQIAVKPAPGNGVTEKANCCRSSVHEIPKKRDNIAYERIPTG